MTKLVLKTAAILAASITLSSQLLAQDSADLSTEDNRISYAIGANVGQNLAAQGLLEGMDIDIFITGMMDAVANEVQMSEQDMMAAIQAFQQRAVAAQQNALAENMAASEAFLADNAGKAGVVTLDSGLQYQVLEEGPADGAMPSATDSVLAHYHGTLPDGSVFDSSVDRGQPATFGLSQVIPGWTEALQLMSVGDKWRLFIPPNLAYGESSPSPAIPPNSALIFDVELLEIR